MKKLPSIFGSGRIYGIAIEYPPPNSDRGSRLNAVDWYGFDMSEAGDGAGAPWWRETVFRSVTLYPWATMDAEEVVADLVDRGVNVIFVVTKESDGRVFYDSAVAPQQVPSRDLLAELVAAAAEYEVAIVPSLFVLCDKHLVEEHPEAVQVAREGTAIRYPNVSAEWMHWACPNHDVVREHLRAVVDELLTYDIDGVQFTHFEFQPVMNGESSYRSCFCDACLARQEAPDPDGDAPAWTAARCETVTELIAELSAPVRERPELLTNVEMEAFADLESAAADSRELLGVDRLSLAEFADVLTLRTAHVAVDMHPLWIRDVVRSLGERTGVPVVPSIRTAGGDRPLTEVPDDELMTAIQMAMHGGSQGVSLFSTGANVGRISDDQWETIESQYAELAAFERDHFRPSEPAPDGEPE